VLTIDILRDEKKGEKKVSAKIRFPLLRGNPYCSGRCPFIENKSNHY